MAPAEVVKLAVREGFTAISICDHDTVAGLPEAIAAAEEAGLELIPGLELGTYFGKIEAHILGYCLDYQNPSLAAVLSRLCEERVKRMEEMIRLLAKAGVELDRTEIERGVLLKNGSVGRLHLARALVAQGFVAEIKEAFHKYIGRGKPAYVPRAHLSPSEGCTVIRQAGGIPVLAHPSQLNSERAVRKLVKEGIMGIEAFFCTAGGGVDSALAEHYCRLAEKHGLLITGGSDCHQESDGKFLLGTVKLDYKYVELLKEKAAEVFREGTPPPRPAYGGG